MKRVKLTVEYDGSAYFGWQFQKGQRSVQEAIEEALFVLFKKQLRITAAGRTDSGVHARNQVVHLDIPDYDPARLKRSLNGLLDADIVIKKAEICSDDFHARFSAVKRCYSYTIALQPSALMRYYAWMVFYPLNLTLMQQGAEILKSYNDFQAFCKVRSDVKNYLCTIYESEWSMRDNLLVYRICANRFLHGMVRAIVGHLLDLGKGGISLRRFKKVIESGQRSGVKTSAPAKGLVLEEVIY